MVAELDVHGSLPELRHAVGEVVDHGDGGALLLHLQEGLVLPLEHQHVGHPAEGDAEVDDLRLRHVVGDVSDVDHFAGLDLDAVLLHLEPFGLLVVVVQGHHGSASVDAIGERVTETKLRTIRPQPSRTSVHGSLQLICFTIKLLTSEENKRGN